jgi:Ca2+-binding EF-hand superfamily protein
MLGVTLSGVAPAQGPSPQKIEEKFKAADVNHDGKLTRDALCMRHRPTAANLSLPAIS